jgi:hypothetical protein
MNKREMIIKTHYYLSLGHISFILEGPKFDGGIARIIDRPPVG